MAFADDIWSLPWNQFWLDISTYEDTLIRKLISYEWHMRNGLAIPEWLIEYFTMMEV
jgi:hypothetical protein